MAKFTTTQIFSDTGQVTSTTLNALVSGLSAGDDLAANSTITVSSGALSVGVLSAANLGALSVTTAKLADSAVTTVKLSDANVTTAKLADASVTAAKLATSSLTWTNTASADRAVQTDMQAESASHFVSPDVLKYHPGVAKATGVVAFANGVATLTNDYNVSGATDTGTGRQITLTNAMDSTDYTVVANCNGGTDAVLITIDTASTFTLSGPSEATGREIHFTVFGTLA